MYNFIRVEVTFDLFQLIDDLFYQPLVKKSLYTIFISAVLMVPEKILVLKIMSENDSLSCVSCSPIPDWASLLAIWFKSLLMDGLRTSYSCKPWFWIVLTLVIKKYSHILNGKVWDHLHLRWVVIRLIRWYRSPLDTIGFTKVNHKQ